MPDRPVFYYDFYSPYSYLAAHRVDDLLSDVEWRPIAFPFLLRHQGRVPWSLGPEREEGQRHCERLAAERGLPLRWPPEWPAGSYALDGVRAAAAADDVRAFSLELYREIFTTGRPMREAVAALGGDVDAGRDVVRADTDEAIALGVYGVPTVAVGGELFWGEDRLEDAAARRG